MTVSYEAGSLVRSRGREWVVLPESEPEFLVLRPLGGADADVAGVFPELEEVEAATFPPPEPDDAGDAISAGLLRTALRVGFHSTAGPFRSLGGLAVEPRPYQLVPLLMALRQEVVRLLIADDVGIGKTIEAGLVASEMLAQGDARGLAVLCSPALAEQWQEELRTKFGIDAELVLPSTVTKLERNLMQTETLFDKHPYVVISTDFIKSPRRRDEFVRACPDLVIVDEAHSCVTDGDGQPGSGRTQRYDLLRKLAADTSRHMVLATATPHSGKDERFRNLLGLLDPELATIDLERQQGRERLARHFVQRQRGDIRNFLDERTPFPKDRLTREEPYALASPYRKLFDTVLDYAYEVVRDSEGGTVRQRVRYWSALALLRALASSPRAAAATLRTRARNVEAETPDEADELGRSAVMDTAYDDAGMESADATPGADDTHEAGSADPHRRRLLDMARQADKLEGTANDAKLASVISTVQGLLADGYDPIVFCRFIDTAEYVAEYLTDELADTAEVRCVTGSLPPAEREARVHALGAVEGRHALVATDCLSEGVNLQDIFQAVVHYDLAWNPTRHEQREGRVDRFGQPNETVRAVTIYGQDNPIDGVVLDVLIRKHEKIRKALGVSVPVPDSSDQVVQAVLEGVLLRRGQSEQLVLDGIGEEHRQQLEREWDSAADRERTSKTKYAQHGIKPGEVQAELDEIRAALGTSDEVEGFVAEALDALGSTRTPIDGGFTATTETLPNGLRDALTPDRKEPLPMHRDLPVPRRHAHLDRTDPNVRALAGYVLDTALDLSIEDSYRPARRCGVLRTNAVSRRTTALLVRFRMHMTIPGRAGPRAAVAEEAKVLAFRGRPDDPQWLDEDEVTALLQAQPGGNVPPDQARDFITRATDGVPALMDALNAKADELAAKLRDSHLRVRESAGQRVRRQLRVEPHKPADVLGVYVYLPIAVGGQ
ncbi:SNF2 family N-terminal domain-containing protein [Haloechinothrix alba]|uniref:SNF2 family N-terminal domain-containing protein n=1 Tax=Haloechinothrix alba TaxID=664784 RepID=A0A238WJZ7_9PSEU|nr:helicase-related protein [Haloechinothrix alba]SNR46807.1 SNF2 family N-terminal domain-containing protein [Haloechinothrix alba]